MSTRRLRTWRFVQMILFMILAIVVALDLAARLAVNEIEQQPFYKRLEEARSNSDIDTKVSDDNNTKDTLQGIKRGGSLKSGITTTLRFSNMGKNYLSMQRANKAEGTKLREITNKDLQPELDAGLDPDDTTTPVSRYPKALLVGFAKCGTSALLAFLNIHPKIVSLDWEIDYFCDRVYFKYSLHWYRLRMPPSLRDQITLEKSPCYGTEPAALDRIKAFNSSIKIMAIVRDPMTRILSQHGQYLASAKVFGREVQSLEERYFKNNDKVFEFPLLKWGTYNERMEQIFAKFPRAQIHIIDGDRFIKDPLPVLKEIESFLEVPSFFSERDVYKDPVKGFYCPRNRETMEALCMPANKGRTHVSPTPVFQRKVLDLIRPYTLSFFELVGYRFNWTL